ncbi:MAG: hypothetical protein ACI93R_004174 [Flavobacteriales bacterium]
MSKETVFAKIESKGFGISWISTTNCWRLVLGSEKKLMEIHIFKNILVRMNMDQKK